jgi:hypothetical protein
MTKQPIKHRARKFARAAARRLYALYRAEATAFFAEEAEMPSISHPRDFWRPFESSLSQSLEIAPALAANTVLESLNNKLKKKSDKNNRKNRSGK